MIMRAFPPTLRGRVREGGHAQVRVILPPPPAPPHKGEGERSAESLK